MSLYAGDMGSVLLRRSTGADPRARYNPLLDMTPRRRGIGSLPGGFNPYQQRRPFMGRGFNPYQQRRPFMGRGMGGFNPYQQRRPFMGRGFNPYQQPQVTDPQQRVQLPPPPVAPQSIFDVYQQLGDQDQGAFLKRFGLAKTPMAEPMPQRRDFDSATEFREEMDDYKSGKTERLSMMVPGMPGISKAFTAPAPMARPVMPAPAPMARPVMPAPAPMARPVMPAPAPMARPRRSDFGSRDEGGHMEYRDAMRGYNASLNPTGMRYGGLASIPRNLGRV